MDTLDGQFLIAMPNMSDTRFERTVIFLCAHSADGAMGFVINRTLATPSVPDFLSQLNLISEDEIETLSPELRSTSLHSGGPVEPGRGFVLHSADFTTDSTLAVRNGICLTATLEILRAISRGKGPGKAMMTLGYSGWGSGQLEEEIAANGWLTSPSDEAIIFDVDNNLKYERALEKLGIDPLLLSGDAGHA